MTHFLLLLILRDCSKLVQHEIKENNAAAVVMTPKICIRAKQLTPTRTLTNS